MRVKMDINQNMLEPIYAAVAISFSFWLVYVAAILS